MGCYKKDRKLSSFLCTVVRKAKHGLGGLQDYGAVSDMAFPYYMSAHIIRKSHIIRLFLTISAPQLGVGGVLRKTSLVYKNAGRVGWGAPIGGKFQQVGTVVSPG